MAKKKSSNTQTSNSDSLAAEQQDRVKSIIRILKKIFPKAECALYHKSAFQLLVATILSAQCTDERVNKSTPELFLKYPDPATLAASSQAEAGMNPVTEMSADMEDEDDDQDDDDDENL